MTGDVSQERKMTDHIEPILRRPRVEESIGLSRSSIYLRVSQGLFTRPVKISLRAVGWPASEVAALNRARIAGQTDVEIRDLVARLHSARGGTVAGTT
jgi:prophage regulatory protein